MKLLVYLSALFILSSCWPTSVSFKDGSVPPEWKAFYFQTIESIAPNAPISYAPQLTESLKDAIQNRTGIRLATDRSDDFQLDFKGKITNYVVSPIAIQGNDNASKNRLAISANFNIFVSAPKEEELKINISRFADFDADQDLGSVEAQLYEEINDQIIQDVLNKLLSNW